MKIEGYGCDVCGNGLSQENGCLIAKEHNSHGEALTVFGWDRVDAKEPNARHFCGQGCFLKFQAAWLTKLSN